MKKVLFLILVIIALQKPVKSLAFNALDYVVEVYTDENGVTTTVYDLSLIPQDEFTNAEPEIEGSEVLSQSSLFELRSTTTQSGIYHYEIDSVVFLDSDGNETDGIVENGSIGAVNLTKLTDETIPANVAVAIYNADGGLRNIYLSKIDGNETANEPINSPFSATFGTNTYGLHIKIFVWDGMTNLTPLAGFYQHIDGRGMVTSIAAISGQSSVLSISGSGFTTLSGKTFTVSYDASALSLVDAVGATPKNDTVTGVATDTGIEVLSISNGSFTFSVDKIIPVGKTWGGVLDLVKFNGLKTGTTNVVVTVE